MILHTAEVVFTGRGRLERNVGVVVDDDGVVVEVSPLGAVRTAAREHHAHHLLMPGVINAHTHLTDAEIETPVPGGGGLTAWVRRLLHARLARPEPVEATAHGDHRRDNGPKQSVSLAAVASVLRRMRDAGTVAIGEVANGTATLEPVVQSGMTTRFIQEILAFPASAAKRAFDRAREVEASEHWTDVVTPTLGIHAPYSVSPELAVMIRDHNRHCGRFTYEHLVEDPAERELYVNGGGPWKEYLQEIGVWDDSWRAPGVSPLEHYDRLGLLGPDLVAVHLADATAEEIALVARRGVRVILSPTSNLHIGNRLPPLEEIVGRRIPFALGTDGRGSNPSVDVFDEARLLAERFEWLDGMLLLEALTANGADVLGFGALGVIERGRRPGLVAVEIADLSADDSTIARSVITAPLARTRIV